MNFEQQKVLQKSEDVFSAEEVGEEKDEEALTLSDSDSSSEEESESA